jgi:hypothetical protein
MAWLPLTDAAEVYQCSTRTLRRYITKGKLTSKLSNGQRMVWFAEQVHTVSSHHHSIPKDRYVMRLFELYEGLSTLRMRFEGPLEMADFLAYASPPASQGKASEFHENCRFFFENLDKSFRQVDKLLNTFDLDQTVLLTLYRTFVILTTHWQESGLHLHEEQREEKVKGQSNTLAIFCHLLEHVRMLLQLCAQQSPSETETHTVMMERKLLGAGQQARLASQDDIAVQAKINVIASRRETKNKPPLNTKIEDANVES